MAALSERLEDKVRSILVRLSSRIDDPEKAGEFFIWGLVISEKLFAPVYFAERMWERLIR